MIKSRLDNIKRQNRGGFQSATTIQNVRIKEYFPESNTVTVTILNSDGASVGTIKGKSADRQYMLGARSDTVEASPPQTGDAAILISNGWQTQTGFVLLTHSKGSDYSRQYLPVRGSWAI